MSFGDILKDWDELRKEEDRKKRMRGEAAGKGDARSAGDGASAPKAPTPTTREPASTTREQVLAYLNRYGAQDKDAELDREAEEADSARAERDRIARMRPEASIDLHGMTEESALESLRAFLEDSRRRGYRKVLIIHGKGNHSEGDPVLKRAVRRLLEGYPGAGRSGKAGKEHGGSGATWLILREG